MASLWDNAAVSKLLTDGDQDHAVRTAEAVTALVERRTHLTLVQRTLPAIYRKADEDPIELPEFWRPNPVIVSVKGSADKTIARSAWPAIEYDYDGVRNVYSRGGWPRQSVERNYDYRTNEISARPKLLPSVEIIGQAGVLSEPLGENLIVSDTALHYADLFGAAEDLLKIVWAMRQADQLMSAEEIESGDQKLTWARRWPQHIRDTLERYSWPGIDG